jgi:hypothetical protein
LAEPLAAWADCSCSHASAKTQRCFSFHWRPSLALHLKKLKWLRKELLKHWFALIFDVTTRLGEAINMVTRSITDEFQICMRLIAFKTLKVHVDGPGLTLFGVLE